jgi:RNA polymerase sigma factor for flagellar operon FliA
MMADGATDFSERDELILQELPQVNFIASRILERLPQQVELSDLVQAGVIGLLEAYRSFDPSKNAQFKTFARFRIKGAILDSLRALDWGSREIRRRAREIADTIQLLQARHGRTPTAEEIAAEMHIDIRELNEIQDELHSLTVLGQEAASTFDGEAAHDLIDSAPSTWDNPFQAYCKAEDKARLADAIAALPEREQLILSLYYQEELTMKEVAQVVGLATSRVSQIHAASLAQLHRALTENRPQLVRRAG